MHFSTKSERPTVEDRVGYIALNLQRGIENSEGRTELLADLFRWASSDRTFSLEVPSHDPRTPEFIVTPEGDTEVDYLASVTEEERLLIDTYFQKGSLSPSAYIAPTLVVNSLGVARTLFVGIDGMPGQYGISFGRVTSKEGVLTVADPLPVSICDYIPDGKGDTFGTKYYDPQRNSFKTELSQSPVGGHLLADIETRVSETQLAHARCKGLPGLSLPEILAVHKSPIMYKDEPIYGLVYKRPPILMPWQAYEAARIARDPEFWEFFTWKWYANLADTIRQGNLAHMQLHGSNRGVTLEEEMRAYIGDWTTTVDLEQYDTEKEFVVVLGLFGDNGDVHITKVPDISKIDLSAKIGDKGFVLHMSARELIIFQSLLVPFEHDFGLVGDTRIITPRMWPQYTPSETPFTKRETLFHNTMQAIDKAFSSGDPNHLRYDQYLAQTNIEDPYDIRNLLRELDEIASGDVSKTYLEIEDLDEFYFVISRAFGRILLAHIMSKYFGSTIVKPCDFRSAVSYYEGEDEKEKAVDQSSRAILDAIQELRDIAKESDPPQVEVRDSRSRRQQKVELAEEKRKDRMSGQGREKHMRDKKRAAEKKKKKNRRKR